MQTSSARKAAMQEDLTMVRDIVITIRDEMPDVGKNELTTGNHRRAMRRALLKLLAVWRSMYEASELSDGVRGHRVDRIDRMMAAMWEMMRAPEQEDGLPCEQMKDDSKRKDAMAGNE